MTIEFVGGATIFVKILHETGNKKKRLKVRMGNGKCRQPSLTIPGDYDTEYKENFSVAARLFADKLRWEGNMVVSWMGDDALFIFTN